MTSAERERYDKIQAGILAGFDSLKEGVEWMGLEGCFFDAHAYYPKASPRKPERSEVLAALLLLEASGVLERGGEGWRRV